MFPKLFEFDTPDFLRGLFGDTIAIYSYGVMIALGVLVGFYIALHKSKRFGIDSDQLSNLFIWVIIAAFVGGKLFFYFEDPQHYLENPGEMLDVRGGGFVFYGSLIFAVPTIVWWLRRKKIPMRPFMDILAFVGPVVHSFGRVGCFLAGCCHGKVCHNVFAVTFNHPETLADPAHTPLYPTQLFDIAVNLIVLATVFILQRKKQFEGQLFLIYLMMYAVGRSIVEIFRGDEERGYVIDGVLSHSQFIAVVILAVSFYFWKKWKASDNKA